MLLTVESFVFCVSFGVRTQRSSTVPVETNHTGHPNHMSIANQFQPQRPFSAGTAELRCRNRCAGESVASESWPNGCGRHMKGSVPASFDYVLKIERIGVPMASRCGRPVWS